MAKVLSFPGCAPNPAAALVAPVRQDAPDRAFSVTRLLRFDGNILQVMCNVRASDPVHAIGQAEDAAPFEGLLVGVTVTDIDIHPPLLSPQSCAASA